MRVLRLAALLGSLILLVATAVAMINRRGDVRVEQVARVELTSTVAEASVRATIDGLNELVELTAVAAAGLDEGTEDGAAAVGALTEQLAASVPGSEACVVLDSAVCTDAPLFTLDTVSELGVESAARAAAGDVPPTAVGAEGERVYVVRRLDTVDPPVQVALSIPDEALLSDAVSSVAADADAEVQIVIQARSTSSELGLVEVVDGQRVVLDVIGSPFAVGSIEVRTTVDAGVGIAADRSVRYLALFALGTILLALAGWTFLVERRQLERRATTDELTDLINRREFERVSEEALDIADRFNTGLCVMVIDLNGFKQINDQHGHQFGDLVLKAASERFVDAVRDTDVVGRWGGDEFVILLPGLSERTAVRNSAERIWNKLASSPVVGDTTIHASIGAAIFPRHGTTLESLMRAADVAMYEAKTTGVSHRIADTIAVGESLLSPDRPAGTTPESVGERTEVVTDEYAGPDRRRSPVPPPPAPPGGLPGPAAADRPADGLDAPDVPRRDEPSIR